MQLIERYLQAVQFWLPKVQRDDILAELSEDIRCEVEEREAELGHRLEEAELEALLRQRGSPLTEAQAIAAPTDVTVYGCLLFATIVCVARCLHGAYRTLRWQPPSPGLQDSAVAAAILLFVCNPSPVLALGL